MAKSGEVAILAALLSSGQNGQRGRLGPPESELFRKKHGKAGKERKSRFRTT